MAIPQALQQNLIANGIPNGSPGWQIVNAARMLPALPAPGGMGPVKLIGDSPTQAMAKLMKAFYDYGRLHFTWSQSSPAAAGNGGLLTGAATNCACATFNGNLKKLAEACGLTGIQNETLTDQFLTVPGGVCIDSKWQGNVRTDRDGYHQFRSYKFAQHYWLSMGGMHYDVCYNNTFVNRDQIIWTHLDAADPTVLRDSGLQGNQVYKLRKPLPNYDYLLMTQQNGPGGWPGWQLVTRAQIKSMRR